MNKVINFYSVGSISTILTLLILWLLKTLTYGRYDIIDYPLTYIHIYTHIAWGGVIALIYLFPFASLKTLSIITCTSIVLGHLLYIYPFLATSTYLSRQFDPSLIVLTLFLSIVWSVQAHYLARRI